jgi:hypothetical protein
MEEEAMSTIAGTTGRLNIEPVSWSLSRMVVQSVRVSVGLLSPALSFEEERECRPGLVVSTKYNA